MEKVIMTVGKSGVTKLDVPFINEHDGKTYKPVLGENFCEGCAFTSETVVRGNACDLAPDCGRVECGSGAKDAMVVFVEVV